MSALQAECRRFESDYLHQPPLKLRLGEPSVSQAFYRAEARKGGRGFLLFENRKLEIKENYNSYNEIDDRKVV